MFSLFVENISKRDCAAGLHLDPTKHPTVLVQICDLDDEFAEPRYHKDFVRIVRVKFSDVDDPLHPDCISESHARLIADALLQAKKDQHHVVVHCFAGICRSGAVAEVGTMLGFTVPPGRSRIPNSLVKRRLTEKLDLAYDPLNSPFATLCLDPAPRPVNKNIECNESDDPA